MKKILSLLLILMCIVACMLTLPIEADAATEGYYTYSVSNGEATITGVSTSISGAITIPSTLGGYPVTSIGYYAFNACLRLTSVTIPDSVTRIGTYAFCDCTGLISVTIPDSVTSIEVCAFDSCSSLTSVTIPDSVTSIGDYAFRSCSSLTSVTIGDSLRYIGNDAFSNCTSLTGIWVDEDNQSYSSDNSGVLFNKDKTTLIAMPRAHSGDYTIPDSVTSIGNYAFCDCTGLISVTIPDSVTTIGAYAFRSCSSLTSVTIPDSVTGIGNYAFSGCTGLTSVTIGDSVTSIGTYAFRDCTGLISVTIPDSVTTIGAYAFRSCSSLTSVTIPDRVTSIGNSAFSDCTGLTSVTIGNSVTSIGHYAFSVCSSLTSVTIPDSVTSIGACAFDNCSRLTSVTISDSVTTIGDNAFSNCSSLTSVTIPDSVTYLGGSAFWFCTGLTSVTIGDGVTSIGNSAFYYCTSLTSVTISDSVTTIGDNAFSNCSSLTSVTIPDSVTSIGRYAFYNCSRLTSVTYCGTENQWNQINIGSNNSALTNAERNYHNWQDATCTEPKTCILCGETTGEAIGHNWQDGACTTPKTCTICGETGEAPGHSYVTEILAPTFTASGQQQKVCSVCGDTVTEAVDMLVGEVSGWNVTLQDDLQVNFHLNISASIESTARVRIVVGEEGYTFRVSGLEKTEDGLYVASVNIAAAQMTDFIFVTVINGSDLAETASYTVRGYADTILADESFSEYHALVKEMLNYGAAAQLYFDYEEENLANEGIADAGSAEIPDSVDSALSVTGNAEGVTFYGASLIFRNRIAVRYYFQFKGDINDCSFAVNDTTYAPQLKDGLYYVEIADILPQDLDQQIALTVTDANGSTLTVAYSPMNYIVRMSEKGSAALQNLVKALYNYHLAAKALSA